MRRWQDKRKGAAAGHVDDWMMTYVDMITLLLCFFAVMLIVALAKKGAAPVTPPPAPVVVAQIAMTPPMQHPDAPIVPPAPPFVEGNLPFHNLGEDDVEDTHVEAAAPAPAPVAEAPVVAPPVEAVASVAPTPEPPASSFSDILTSLKAQGNADLEQKGDRLTTIEINSAAFFGSGSATLSSDGAMILRKVADNLKSGAYKDYLITVEGHTDDTPIHTAQFPSNWELSTGRASAVVRFFMEQGISSQQLRAAGYADTFPKLPNRTASGDAIPANQATNRRVVIKLEKIEKI